MGLEGGLRRGDVELGVMGGEEVEVVGTGAEEESNTLK